MFKNIVYAISGVLLTTAAAQAENRWPQWYVGLHGDVTFVDETDISISGVNSGEVSFDTGWGAGASIGYMPNQTASFLDMMRFEFELAYRENSTDVLNPGGTPLADDLSSVAYMINAFVDIDTQTQLSPYVGAGIGLASVELNVPTLPVNDEDTVMAYQLMAGLGYQPESLPRTAFSIGYKYFFTEDPNFRTTTTGLGVEHDYDSHNIELGARFIF